MCKASNQQGFDFLNEELVGFYHTPQSSKKTTKDDPPHTETRWHHLFHLLLEVFSRTVQEKALNTKPIFLFELSKLFRTLLQLSKAVLYVTVIYSGCLHAQLSFLFNRVAYNRNV